MDKNKNHKIEYTNNTTTKTSSDWKQATGEINIKLVNDYLFRALLQRNNHVLKRTDCLSSSYEDGGYPIRNHSK